jgi:hypothetical protein
MDPNLVVASAAAIEPAKLAEFLVGALAFLSTLID